MGEVGTSERGPIPLSPASARDQGAQRCRECRLLLPGRGRCRRLNRLRERRRHSQDHERSVGRSGARAGGTQGQSSQEPFHLVHVHARIQRVWRGCRWIHDNWALALHDSISTF